MKSETILTTFFLVFVIALIILLRRYAFGVLTIAEDLSMEISLWSFGVVVTNTSQSIVQLVAAKPNAAQRRVHSSIPGYMQPMCRRVDPLILQLLLMGLSLLCWIYCIVVVGLAMKVIELNRDLLISSTYLISGSSIGFAYISLETKE